MVTPVENNGPGDVRKTRPKARRFRRRFLAAMFLVLILAGPFLAVRVGPVRTALLRLATDRLGLGETLRVQIGGVHGFGPTGFAFRDVSLESRDSTGVWVTAMHMTHLEAAWSLSRLVGGEVHVDRFEAGAVEVYLHRLPRGAPRDTSEAEPAGGRRTLPLAGRVPITVAHVALGPLKVFDADGVILRMGLAGGWMEATRQELRFTLEEGWLALDRYGSGFQLTSGALVWGQTGGMRLTDLALDGPRLQGLFEAHFRPDHPENPLVIDLLIDHLDPLLLTRHFVPGIRLRPEDELAGSVQMRTSKAGIGLELLLEGRLRGERFDELSGVIDVAGGQVRVTDLVISGERGSVRGQGTWDPRRRAVTGKVCWDDLDLRTRWLPWLHDLPVEGSFDGRADAQVLIPRSASPRIEGEIELGGVRLFDIETDRIRFAGVIEPGNGVEAREALLMSRGGQIRARGRWPLGTGEVEISAQVDSFPLSALPPAWRADTEGRLSGAFELEGVPDDPVIEGHCRLSDLVRGEWHADEATLIPLLVWPRDLRGSGTLEVRGLQRKEGSAAWMSTRFSRWGERVSLSTDVGLPGAHLHLEGRLDPERSLALEQLQVGTDRWGRWRLEQPCELDWASGGIRSDSLILRSGPARLAAGGHWVRESDEVALGVSLRSFDLAQLEPLLGAARPWRGTGGLVVDASGRLPDPRVEVAFSADSLWWGAANLGNAFLHAVWADSTLRIQPIELHSEFHDVSLPTLTLSPKRPLLSLMGGGEDPCAEASPGNALADASWEGRLEVSRLDLAGWAPALGLLAQADSAAGREVTVERTIGGRPVRIHVETPGDLSPVAAGVGGYGGLFKADVAIGGTPRGPVLLLRGGVEDVTLAGVPSGTLELDLQYADSVLSIVRVNLQEGESRSYVEGSYPYLLQLLPPEAGRLGRPVDVRGELLHFDVGLVSGFTPWAPDAHGRLSGSLTLGGRGDHPHVLGLLLLRDGGLRIPGRSERVFDTQAMARIDSSGLHIDQLSARTAGEGRLSVEGWVRGARAFDLTAHAEMIQLLQHGSYDFLVSADSIRAVTRPPEGAPEGDPTQEAVPHLEGRIEVLRGVYMHNPGSGARAPSPSERPSPWRVDFDVLAPGNIRVRQSNASADLGDGQLRLSYRWPYWDVSGSVGVLGGTYRLLNNNFAIQEGQIEFRDTGHGPDASVSVDAETYVAPSDTTDTGGDVRVMVHVEGKPDELQVTLSSDPPHSQEQLVELLSYGRLPRSAWEAASETPTFLLGTMGGTIESSLAEQFPLFSHVALEHGATAQDMRLSVRPMISRGITGNYSQELSLDPAWDFSLHYRLSRILYLRAGVANDPERAGPFIDEYSLDLKFRFEYE